MDPQLQLRQLAMLPSPERTAKHHVYKFESATWADNGQYVLLIMDAEALDDPMVEGSPDDNEYMDMQVASLLSAALTWPTDARELQQQQRIHARLHAATEKSSECIIAGSGVTFTIAHDAGAVPAGHLHI